MQDFDERKSEISSRLNMFPIPWKDEYFGTEGNLTVELKLSGTILVTGLNKDACISKIEKVRKTIEDIYKSPLPYKTPELEKIEFRENAETNISKIVFPGIMDVVKEEISKEYDIKDVSFLFTSEKREQNLHISFERTSYVKGKETVPLEVFIIAPTEDICQKIWQSLVEKLDMKIRNQGK